jgi:hypothetical protein
LHLRNQAPPEALCVAFDGRIGSTLVVQQVAKIVPRLSECRICSRGTPESGFGLDIASMSPEHISKIE